MPLRKHFAFRKNGRVYINHAAYAALQQESTRLQNKKNMEREKAIIAVHAEERRRRQSWDREQAQLRALTAFLEERGVNNPNVITAPQQQPMPVIPPAVNIMQRLPNSFRTGIPLLLSRLRELGEIVPVAIFHSRKHARPSKSKLRAVASFGATPLLRPPGTAPRPPVRIPERPGQTIQFVNHENAPTVGPADPDIPQRPVLFTAADVLRQQIAAYTGVLGGGTP